MSTHVFFNLFILSKSMYNAFYEKTPLLIVYLLCDRVVPI